MRSRETIIWGGLTIVALLVLRFCAGEGDTSAYHAVALIVVTSAVTVAAVLTRSLDRSPLGKLPYTEADFRALPGFHRSNRRPVNFMTRYLAPFDWALFAALVLLFAILRTRVGIGADELSHQAAQKLRHVLVGVAMATSAGYLSTLVDRYYVLPRVHGTYWPHRLQCLDDGSIDRWKVVTQVWLWHRILAQIGVVGAVGFVTARLLVDFDVPVINPLGAAVFSIIGGLYIARLFPIILFALNPALSIGDSVEIAEEYTVRRAYPLYFVVDIALEGVKLLALRFLPDPTTADARPIQPPAEPHGRFTRVRDTSASTHRTHDRVLGPNDAARLLRNRDWRRPCPSLNECAKVNRYCPRVRLDNLEAGASRDETSSLKSSSTTSSTDAADGLW